MKIDFENMPIFCISHPDSIGRLEQMHHRFKGQGMNVSLVPGVEPKPGEERFLGCLRAHQNAVKYAKQKSLPAVAIFEDDVVFLQTWNWIKDKLKDVPEDFDLVRLSVITDGTYHRKHVDGNIFRCAQAFGTQAYVVHSKCFDRILALPETDPYDLQLSHAGLIEYSVHPMPLYHELGTSILGNPWQQTRDDFKKEITRDEAVQLIEQVLDKIVAPYQIQLRIMQSLSLLRERANTQELRFLRQVIDKTDVTKEQALQISQALFTLSLAELAN